MYSPSDPDNVFPLLQDSLPAPVPINLKDPRYYLNRELSLLQFHLRVLEQAKDESIPLLERLKFLLIFSNNLDEFFEIRVAGLKQQIRHELPKVAADGLLPQEVLKTISDTCHQAVDEQYRILNQILFPALVAEGVRFLRRSEWTPAQSEWARQYFKEQILPVVSPLGLDPAHPFPRIANKSLNFIVLLEGRDAFGRQSGLAVIPAPRSLPRIIQFPENISAPGFNFAFLSSMIHAHAEELFPGMTVKGSYQFRLTRNADLHVNEDVVDDLALALKGELLSRRYGDEVRLEVADNCPDELVNFLLKKFKLNTSELYKVSGMVNLARLFAVTQLDIPQLKYQGFTPGVPRSLKTQDPIFDAIAKKDILLHHPYESFRPVIDFIKQAARDPKVLAIKQTLYRIGANSEIMDLLVEAARNGKEVTAIIELRARFDEASNLEGAARLQSAGAIVAYGIVGYKTHSKMTLVVRRETSGQLKRYVHLGTGNYHAENARIYTDISLLSADEQLGEDTHKLFLQMTGMGKAAKLKRLLHAPFTLHARLMELIEQERQNALAGKPARIMAKLNALTETQLIEALYRASQAGVEIQLIVRGMCCLKPGIPGVSDNIHVRSIVGRFLEHSRIYYFHNNDDPYVFCSSADWMERNLFHRLETCFPIDAPQLKQRITEEGLKVFLNDNQQSWLLDSQGCYHLNRIQNEEVYMAQLKLLQALSS